MQVKSKSGRMFDVPSPEEGAHIRQGIDADPDAFTVENFKDMRPLGRPKVTVTKQPVSIRLSPEVVNWFKSTGKGWQTRMDAVLKDYVATHR